MLRTIDLRSRRPKREPKRPDRLEQRLPHNHACKMPGCTATWPCQSLGLFGYCVAAVRGKRYGWVCVDCATKHADRANVRFMVLGPGRAAPAA